MTLSAEPETVAMLLLMMVIVEVMMMAVIMMAVTSVEQVYPSGVQEFH